MSADNRIATRRRHGATSPFDILAAAQAVAKTAGGHFDPPSPDLVDMPPDARGYHRTIATTSAFHIGREPANKGKTYPPDPPSVAECMAMLRACHHDVFGARLYAAVVLGWQGALRAFEILALSEDDLDEKTGRLVVRRGKGDKRATISMPAWAWPYLDAWRKRRALLPDPRGALICVIDGPTAGRAWSYSHFNGELKKVAVAAGITRRMSPHQLRHACAAHMYAAGVDLRTIQLHLRHANIGITDTYLRGLGLDQSREHVYQLAVPTVPATALLELAQREATHA